MISRRTSSGSSRPVSPMECPWISFLLLAPIDQALAQAQAQAALWSKEGTTMDPATMDPLSLATIPNTLSLYPYKAKTAGHLCWHSRMLTSG